MPPVNRAQPGYATSEHSGAFYNSTIDAVNAQTQFGQATGPDLASYGGINRQVSSGVNPGATAVDSVLAVYSLPAGALANLNQGLTITGKGSFGATANNKTLKLIWGATAAVVGQAVTGGTTIATSGVVATNGGGWSISAEVYRTDATHDLAFPINPLGAPIQLTVDNTQPTLIALTGNAATAVGDISAFLFEILGKN